jgi:hypothetical protein
MEPKAWRMQKFLFRSSQRLVLQRLIAHQQDDVSTFRKLERKHQGKDNSLGTEVTSEKAL